MTQYVILCAPSPADLAQKITEAVSGGWKVEGGLCQFIPDKNPGELCPNLIVQLMSKRMSR